MFFLLLYKPLALLYDKKRLDKLTPSIFFTIEKFTLVRCLISFQTVIQV
jgi:hypothetical protein